MEIIPDELKQKSFIAKVLGLEWDSKNDTLQIQLWNKSKVEKWTKRNVLKFIASAFDPLGFLSPVTVKGRAFMQELFKEGLTWDEPLPEKLLKVWQPIFSDWNGIVKIPRRLTLAKFPGAQGIEIHAFGDASQTAYCACVYLRIQTSSECVTPLIFAKTRLQPLNKNLTIPKMEVMGIWLASKISSFVAKELGLEVCQRFIWTDSQISCYWFQKHPKDVFVTNRLKEVLETRSELMFVPGKLNPADLGTRGVKFEELVKAHFWWKGPDFLRKSKEKWPKFPKHDSNLTQTATVFVAINDLHFTTVLQNVEIHREFDVSSGESWTSLKRAAALQLFPDKTADTLTVKEIQFAERALIAQEQQVCLTAKLEKDFKCP
uniref:Pao retrotransposon peptidase n=1 Tax=Panagrolaimus superbus TaxID=310955 RepID=A0A914YTS1_9BILA